MPAAFRAAVDSSMEHTIRMRTPWTRDARFHTGAEQVSRAELHLIRRGRDAATHWGRHVDLRWRTPSNAAARRTTLESCTALRFSTITRRSWLDCGGSSMPNRTSRSSLRHRTPTSWSSNCTASGPTCSSPTSISAAATGSHTASAPSVAAKPPQSSSTPRTGGRGCSLRLVRPALMRSSTRPSP